MMTPSVKAAMKTVQNDGSSSKEIDNAVSTLLGEGLCPDCAAQGETSRLRKWQAGNYYENAGRECPNCEAFHVCGIQPEYADAMDCHSDADPGL